ncbi:hypothetical protein PRIPAC_77501 [Pristionchus pacificus]|uniref:Uncharacterized protein n=1 Tax=Pristionchus pacificus TaxID=54126 RepID=A0A2A6C362_PRIPA|nr:hypothetical protein PRIPAC_77501 [Pristionchus pacificus]|eukprot:PDM72672.1 hypothetical protein PRIPAC_39106 [Pristionchus pacificus]
MLSEIETADVLLKSFYLHELIVFRLVSSGIDVLCMITMELHRKHTKFEYIMLTKIRRSQITQSFAESSWVLDLSPLLIDIFRKLSASHPSFYCDKSNRPSSIAKSMSHTNDTNVLWNLWYVYIAYSAH